MHGQTTAREPGPAYRVQVLASREVPEAEAGARQVHALLQARFPVYLQRAGDWYKVRVGDLADLPSARELLGRVRSLGYEDAWLARPGRARTLAVYGVGAEAGSAAPASELAGGSRRSESGARNRVAGSRPPVADVPVVSEGPASVAETPAEAADEAEAPDETDRVAESSGGATDVQGTLAPTGPGSTSTRKRLRAVRSSGSVRLDGRPDEEAWARAEWTSDFQQRGKDRGFAPWDSTRVAFLYDDEALYVAGRMWVSTPEHLRALVGGRDAPGKVERLLVSLDTYRDRQTAYTFGVTAGGARVDYQHARDNEGWTDDSFDPVWEARTAVDGSGWTAEMRIPFSQLRFNEQERPVWGLNIRRWNPSTFLNVYWSLVPYEETGWSSRFGTLVGLPALQASGRVEIVPYVLGGATLPDARLRADGAERELETRVGGDLKVGLASNLTLDATLNPDFGQVEADPAQVNLSQFETFFPEKRPFFLESRHVFHARGPNYFYSRRIGSVPPGTLPPNVLETPVSSRILGAGKITGRLESGLSVGALAALTEPERVAVEVLPGEPGDTGDDDHSVAVSPRTAFGVARLYQELGSAGSGVGVLFTGVNRFMSGDDALSDALVETAVAGGADGALRFGEGLYELSGHAGFSHVRGTREAILRQQISSTRYFQRPDAGHVHLDSTATSLTGAAAGLSIAKIGGAHWLWDATASLRSPGFEIRDAGSQARADRIDTSLGASYGVRGIGSGAIHTYRIGASLGAGWNHDGVRRYTTPAAFFDVTWRNLIRSVLQFELGTRALSDDLTRGGPVMGTPLRAGFRANVTGSPVPLRQWYVNADAHVDELGGRTGSVDGGVSFQPSARFGVSLGPGVTLSRDVRQYFGTLEGGPPETYGHRYVFGALDRTEWYAHFRLDYAVTPDLSLEFYAEPFTGTGRFEDFGELAEAGGRQLRTYGTEGTTIEAAGDGSHLVTDGTESFTLWNADYRVRSLRSNAVLRWEWSRGSALHLIWQQNRWSFDDVARGADPGSLFSALGDPGENLLVAKISYWISP